MAMNPKLYKITREQWEKFQQHYAWQLLQSPDYRLGQAFLNFFNEVDKLMQADGDLGMQDSVKLYYETDNLMAKRIIDKWLEQ
jgi:hypothetical protein